MRFPLYIEGKIELGATSPEGAAELAARVASALIKVRASNVSLIGTSVTFRGGIFRLVSNWNILVPVGWGAIGVLTGSPGVVAYKFSCREMLGVTTLIALVVALFMAFVVPPSAPLFFRLGAPVLMWLWLYGGNYLISRYRLPAFVKDAVVGITHATATRAG
jgi:hypothetical protein